MPLDIPDHVSPDLVVDVDPVRDPQFGTQVFAAFDRLRTYGDLLWTTADGGYWIPTRFADIDAVLRNSSVFRNSSPNTAQDRKYPAGLRGAPVRVDPPEHAEYRALYASLVSRRAAAALVPAIRDEVVGLVSALAPRGRCDLVADLAYPIGTSTAARVVGLPAELTEAFHQWKRALWHRETQDSDAEFIETLLELIKLRRNEADATEGENLISRLLRSKLDGRPMTDLEIVDMVLVFMLGGADTVTSALGFAFQHLAGDPELRARIVAEPDRIPEAMEKLLATYSLVNMTRVAAQDTELCGATIKAGDRVLASTTLASRDPGICPDRGSASPAERPAPHLAFSSGPHRCPGEHIARRELAIVLEEFHRRIPDYEIAAEHTSVTTGAPVISITSLPIVWPVARHG